MTIHPTAVPAVSGSHADRQSPVIVLAYSFAGTRRIWDLVSSSPDIACTAGTGILPLCDEASETWRKIDNRDGPLSPLAVASIRALAAGMITAILAGTGRSRWCEISFSPPTAAETFLRLYPETKFICLHRSCPDVIRAGIDANPWGLADTDVRQFTVAHPGSNAAAIAAYWASRTEPLLRFESARPTACMRVMYKDLASQPGRVAEELFTFLNLAWDDAAVSTSDSDSDSEENGALMRGAQLPAGHLPLPLKQRVNELQGRLGYPPIE
jgi:hypothetical protein